MRPRRRPVLVILPRVPRLSRGMGLSPGDPCFDPNRSSWMPYFWNDDAECGCMAQNPANYTAGQQCFSTTGPAGTLQTMAGQAGEVVGGATSITADTLGSAAGGLISSTTPSGMLMLAALIVGGILVLKTL